MTWNTSTYEGFDNQGLMNLFFLLKKTYTIHESLSLQKWYDFTYHTCINWTYFPYIMPYNIIIYIITSRWSSTYVSLLSSSCDESTFLNTCEPLPLCPEFVSSEDWVFIEISEPSLVSVWTLKRWKKDLKTQFNVPDYIYTCTFIFISLYLKSLILFFFN